MMKKNCYLVKDHNNIVKVNRGGILGGLGNEIQQLIPCFIPEFLISITVNGNVLPCFEDYNQRNIMGSINNQALMDIWNSTNFTSMRQDLLKGFRRQHDICKNCNRLEVFP